MHLLMSVVLLVFVIIAIVDAIKGRLSVEKKILWILFIVFIPVIGLLCYYLIGRSAE